MADTKVSALTATTTPALTDVLPIVIDPGGTPLSRKVTVANLLALAFPVTDSTGVVKGSSDATKILRFEADTNIPTGTTVALTAPAASGTIVTEAGAATVTNKTYDTAGTGNVFKVNGVTATSFETLLSSTTNVNLNASAGTKTPLYTCPAGKSCIVTKIILRSYSTTTSAAYVGFGWDTDVTDWADEIVGTAATTQFLVHYAPTATVTILGAATQVFQIRIAVAEGSAATCTVDVFGYVY